MPRINPTYLDCTIYLYPSKKSAFKGEKFGRSGFLVAIPFEQEINGVQRSHVYAVTNSHVIRESRATVIRLNKMGGGIEVLPFEYKQWIDDWYEDDLAICMLDDTKMRLFQSLMLLPASIIQNGQVDEDGKLYVDIGSDVVLIGRFIAHDGTQKNLPVVRFGNVSMLNWEPVEEERKQVNGTSYILRQESFLIECRTLPGTSGSPVFLSHEAWDNYTIVKDLLGIVWGYMWYNPSTAGESKQNVNLNTGMALVIPAWKLQKFLDRGDLVEQRKKIEQQAIREGEGKGIGGSSAAVISPNEKSTEKGFEAALQKVSRHDKPGKSE